MGRGVRSSDRRSRPQQPSGHRDAADCGSARRHGRPTTATGACSCRACGPRSRHAIWRGSSASRAVGSPCWRLIPPGLYGGGGDRARHRGGDMAGVPDRPALARRVRGPVRGDQSRADDLAQRRAARSRGRRARTPRTRCTRRVGRTRSRPTGGGRRRQDPSVRRSRGDSGWSPQRRFERVFERLSLPGLRPPGPLRPAVTLGSIGTLRVAGAGAAADRGRRDLATAKRVFAIGDRMTLERRAKALAEAADVLIEALDLALPNWAGGRSAITLGVPAEAPRRGRRGADARCPRDSRYAQSLVEVEIARAAVGVCRAGG